MTRWLKTMVLSACLPALAWGGPATVRTPGDGFLALRSEPSTEQGVRLAKIPHGTRLALGDCVRPTATQRWCRTSYGGQAGWVLDSYLDFVADTADWPGARPAAVDPAV